MYQQKLENEMIKKTIIYNNIPKCQVRSNISNSTSIGKIIKFTEKH